MQLMSSQYCYTDDCQPPLFLFCEMLRREEVFFFICGQLQEGFLLSAILFTKVTFNKFGRSPRAQAVNLPGHLVAVEITLTLACDYWGHVFNLTHFTDHSLNRIMKHEKKYLRYCIYSFVKQAISAGYRCLHFQYKQKDSSQY